MVALMFLYIIIWLSQTCPLEDTEIIVSGCSVPAVSKETKLGNSNQETSTTVGKTTISVPTTAISSVVGTTDEFSKGNKITSSKQKKVTKLLKLMNIFVSLGYSKQL